LFETYGTMYRNVVPSTDILLDRHDEISVCQLTRQQRVFIRKRWRLSSVTLDRRDNGSATITRKVRYRTARNTWFLWCSTVIDLTINDRATTIHASLVRFRRWMSDVTSNRQRLDEKINSRTKVKKKPLR